MIKERMTARMPGDYVVFLIGMRINKWWKVHQWVPIVISMTRMIIELSKNRDLGFLSAESWFGRTTIMVQYWESFEKLEAYAKNRNAEHLPAWVSFNKKIRNSGDVGIWHETYLIKAGQYENVYHNMPPFGLGKVAPLQVATGAYQSANQRLDS